MTNVEKAAKKRHRKEYITVFLNGKQKHIKRPPTQNGMDLEEFIRRNGDPIWLHQNGMWEYLEPERDNKSYEAKRGSQSFSFFKRFDLRRTERKSRASSRDYTPGRKRRFMPRWLRH